ncbi:MAG TPA: sigma-70 family RNA polymerase sigma factor [Pirellulales bacterium]|nr:sigma-70 family RNA polymerase sigma factor [Pirellulales bacterium]
MAIASGKREGDLTELVQNYQAGVWRYLRFLGAEESLADDLTQETFLAVWKRPFVDHTPAATRQYLRTVARNLFLMSLRKRNRQPTLDRLELADEVWQQLAGDDEELMLDMLRECVETLNGRGRQVIDLCYRDNRSRAEIGREMDLSDDGVKSLLRRTRELLRRCVEQKRSLES